MAGASTTARTAMAGRYATSRSPSTAAAHSAKAMALELTMWSRDLVICANGTAEFSEEDRALLDRARIGIREERIVGLEGDEGELERIRFDSGEALSRRALFFPSRGRQRCDLAERLGCDMTEKGMIETGKFEKTQVDGVYVAGDASRNVQLVVIAAAEGATAAFAINAEFVKEDIRLTIAASPARAPMAPRPRPTVRRARRAAPWRSNTVIARRVSAVAIQTRLL